MIIHLLEKLANKTIILASNSPRRKQILQEQLKLRHLKVIPSNFDESSLDKASFKTVADFVMENAKQKALSVYHDWCSGASTADGDYNKTGDNLLVIGSDTVVVFTDPLSKQQQILEKPKDEKDAFEMLRKLSSQRHQVLSGVSLIYSQQNNTNINSNQSSTSPPSSSSSSLTLSSPPSTLLKSNIQIKPVDAEEKLVNYHTTNFESYSVTQFYEETTVQFDNLSDEEIQAYVKTKEPLDKAGAYGIQGIGGSFVKEINGCYFNVVGFPLHKFCSTVLAVKDQLLL